MQEEADIEQEAFISIMAADSNLIDGTADISGKIRELNSMFHKACNQIILLNNQIDALQSRYDGAVKANKRAFRYSLRLRLAVLEGVRNMFYEYASRKADELEELQHRQVRDSTLDNDSSDEEHTYDEVELQSSQESMEHDDPGPSVASGDDIESSDSADCNN